MNESSALTTPSAIASFGSPRSSARDEHAIALGEPAGEPEHLDFLRRLVARADVAQVVELPALGRPAEEQGVLQRREVRLAEKARQDRDDEQHAAATGCSASERGAERDERERVLRPCRGAAR